MVSPFPFGFQWTNLTASRQCSPGSTASAYFRMRDTLSPARAWSDTVNIVCRVKPWKKPCA